MLHLETDQCEGAPDLLAPGLHADFEIRSLAGDVIKTFAAPATGWTHEQLVALAVEHERITCDGADGYLGGEWIGSTEI